VAHDVSLARFDAALVLVRIGADDFDVQRGHTGAFLHGTPCAACERPWIHAVGDDGPPCAKVIFRHGVGDIVSLTFDAIACPAQLLLDRVDPEVHRSDRPRELARDRRLADARQPTEDDQHR